VSMIGVGFSLADSFQCLHILRNIYSERVHESMFFFEMELNIVIVFRKTAFDKSAGSSFK
jgi:hypothetical protein